MHRSGVIPGPPGATSASNAPGASSAAITLERRFFLLGTEARVTVVAPSHGEAREASERAYQALTAAEARLSTWSDRSELARLNAAPLGRPVPLSPELTAELSVALACRERTGGAFDPEVGHLVAAWGLRTGGRVPAPEEIAALAAEARLEGLELDGVAATARRLADRGIEEGAWGKGAALDRALAALGPGIGGEIDLGGQVGATAGRATTVALAHPADRSRRLLELEIRGGSLATSGNGERGLTVGGRRIGHLLDPRTARPATDFGSVTVWAPTALEADCLATGLFVLGPDAALAFAARHPEIAVVVVETAHRRVRASAGLAGRLRWLDPDLDFSFVPPPDVPAAETKEEGAGTAAWTADGSDSPVNRGDRAFARPPFDSTGV